MPHAASQRAYTKRATPSRDKVIHGDNSRRGRAQLDDTKRIFGLSPLRESGESIGCVPTESSRESKGSPPGDGFVSGPLATSSGEAWQRIRASRWTLSGDMSRRLDASPSLLSNSQLPKLHKVLK